MRYFLIPLAIASLFLVFSCAERDGNSSALPTGGGSADDDTLAPSADDDSGGEIDLDANSGWPIDAQILDDGSLVVLYTSDAQIIDPGSRPVPKTAGPGGGPASSSLVWFDKNLRPIRQIKPGMNFPHTLDYDGSDLLVSDSINGRLLLVSEDGSNMRFIEFDGWDYGDVYPNGAEFTSDGQILFSDIFHGVIYKVTRTGKFIWSRDILHLGEGLPGQSSDELHGPEELAEGHLLYCLSKSGQVVEIDADGEEVWRYNAGLNWPKSVQRLSSGTTLITDLNRIIEVAPDGAVVWQYDSPSSANMNTIRYDDGNTLNATNDVKLIALDGTILWELAPEFANPKSGRPENDHRKLILRSLGYLG